MVKYKMLEFTRGDTLALQVIGRESGVTLSANLKKVKEGSKVPKSTEPIAATFVVEDSVFESQDSWLIKLTESQTGTLEQGEYAIQLKRTKTDFTTHSKVIFTRVKESLF